MSLSSTPPTGTKLFIDRVAGARCGEYKAIGMWSGTVGPAPSPYAPRSTRPQPGEMCRPLSDVRSGEKRGGAAADRFMEVNVRIPLCLLLLVASYGCGGMSVERQPRVAPTVTQREERSTSYQIGREQTVSVGEPLIKVASSHVTETIHSDIATPDRAFDGVCEVPGPDIRFRRDRGSAMQVLGSTTIDGVKYQILLVANNLSGEPIGIAVDPVSGQTHASCVWRNALRGWVLVGNASFSPNPGPLFSFATPRIQRTPGDKNFELIYSGVSKQTIALLYREYTKDDLARPAFYQNLSYDLSESDIVAFRTFRIRVIKATNQEIRYVVIAE